jgi:hypothetical protein
MRINRLKKVIKVFLIILAILLIIVIAIVGCALITYHKQPVLTKEDKEELSVDNIWKTRTEPEMAEVIEDNGDALLERIKLISNARDEIILSTFDFRADDSGKLILGALLDASERGVSVNVIVDGVSGFLRMNGNPYFEALAAGEGTSIKIYNKVNPFAPWKSMGRLHDKYLIADRSSYIIGGRNTFSYFLGSSSPYKNYDRDALVYCENPDENSSVNDILSYFGKVWNYKESKAFINGVNAITDTDTYFTISENNEYNYCVENTYSDNNSLDSSRITDKKNKLASKKKVAAAREELHSLYADYCADNADNGIYKGLGESVYKDMFKDAYEVNNVALMSNPIEYSSKKPYVWYQLVELMKKADSRVKLHTPYIICNDYMYEGLKSVCDSVDDVSLMTNSVANNGNPFGSADYYVNKNRILGTGIDVWEYEGGYSYHGKSVLIDDNISVIGSFNIDMRSAYLDTELMLVIDSNDINRELNQSMEGYERVARKADKDGSYDNPYNVKPVELSSYRERQMKLIKNFVLWARYLF